jgi:hypothetical protein
MKTLEPRKRAHSPQLAAGLASVSENGKLPYGRRFPAACCRDLRSLVQKFVEGHPQDAAKVLEELDLADAWIFAWL